MRPARPSARALGASLVLIVFLGACDTGGGEGPPDGDPALSGLYVGHDTTDFGDDGVAQVALFLDVPTPTAGTFQLGGRSRFEAELGASSDAYPVTGTGSVDGREVSVSIAAPPDLSVVDGAVRFTDVGDEPFTLSGTVSADGDVLTFREGGASFRFERE